MKNIISSHNNKILNEKNNVNQGCNFRKKTTCPLEGKCLASSNVYAAEFIPPHILELKP